MISVFSKRIRQKRIDPKHWRDIIHVPFAWGLKDSSGRRLEGASGMQLGSVLVLNAFLSIPNNSNLALATANSSQLYLLPEQRHFLLHLNKCAGVVREYITNSINPLLGDAFNKCVNNVLRWRVSHQKRGEMYLSCNNSDDSPQIATGLTIPEGAGSQEISEIFSRDMQERIEETKNSIIK